MRPIRPWFIRDPNLGQSRLFSRVFISCLSCPIMLKRHDDVIKLKHFPRYWSFVQGIHRSPVNSPHKGQWREALMFSLISAWTDGSQTLVASMIWDTMRLIITSLGGTENGSHASHITSNWSKFMLINSGPATPNMSQIFGHSFRKWPVVWWRQPITWTGPNLPPVEPKAVYLHVIFHKNAYHFILVMAPWHGNIFHIISVGGKPPVTGWFPTQRASNAESAPKEWCHHAIYRYHTSTVLSFSSWKADANSEQKYARSRFWSHRQIAATPAKPL